MQGCLLEGVCFANLGWAIAEKAARDGYHNGVGADEMLPCLDTVYIELNCMV